MTIWQINTFIALVNLGFLLVSQRKADHLMKLRYPELHFLRKHWTTVLTDIIKAVVISFCPGFNIVVLYVLITKDSQLIEETIEDARQAYLRQARENNKETNNGDHDVNQGEDRTSV